MKNPSLIKAILIDPFQMELYPVEVERDSPRAMAKLLDCEHVQSVNLQISAKGTKHFAWVDEEGLLREPFVYPHWVLGHANGGQGIAGYGVVTGMNEDGSMADCCLPMSALIEILAFEKWRSRIRIDDVIPQMMRVYTLA